MEEPLPSRPGRRPALRHPERAAAVIVLVAAAVATAFLAIPGAPAPVSGEESLGLPARSTIRAARDLAIPDEEGTRRRREEAAADEPRVFDHDLGAAQEVAARVHGAFQLMRRSDPRSYASHRAGFASRLQLSVDDASFAALARDRFREGTEAHLVSLTARALAGPVVQERSFLDADRERGIRIRDVKGGSVRDERTVRDVDGIADLTAARAEVERTAASLPGLAPRLRPALARVASGLVHPTLVLSQAETERRRAFAAASVAPVVVAIRRGDVIVPAGERIERRHVAVLRGMHEQTRLFDRAAMRLGAGVIAGIILVVLWAAAARLGGTIRPRRRGALLLSGLYLAMLGIAAGALALVDKVPDALGPLGPEAVSLLVPMPAAAAIAAMLLSPAAGVLLAIAIGSSVELLGGQSAVLGIQVTLASVTAALLLAHVQRRRHVWRAGLLVGAMQALVVAASWLLAGKARLELPPLDLVASLAAAFLSGALLLPLAVVILVPPLERILGLASDLRLRDLGNLNHPALKELIIQAPGTWHHSVVTGALAEAGAAAIGADALLARVGAYYHDIGKAQDASAFLENTRGENRLADLPPEEAAKRIRSHVELGVAAARRWKLPRAIVEIVAQHHGTRPVAPGASQDRGSGHAATPSDPLVRYAGPRPGTREAGLVMIADASEIAARELADPTPERMLQAVRRRIGDLVEEGQLDESELAIGELDAIARAMVAALDAVYRGRSASAPPPPADRPPSLQLVQT